MHLQPRRRPGRNDRKAALYAEEILRLRAEGYTYEAIRESLADLGVVLSTSALRREVSRHQPRLDVDSSATRSTSRTFSTSAGSTPLAPSVDLPSRMASASGHQIAEAFFDAHPSNPLLRAKETP
jgi:hypothetical protein